MRFGLGRGRIRKPFLHGSESYLRERNDMLLTVEELKRDDVRGVAGRERKRDRFRCSLYRIISVR